MNKVYQSSSYAFGLSSSLSYMASILSVSVFQNLLERRMHLRI